VVAQKTRACVCVCQVSGVDDEPPGRSVCSVLVVVVVVVVVVQPLCLAWPVSRAWPLRRQLTAPRSFHSLRLVTFVT